MSDRRLCAESNRISAWFMVMPIGWTPRLRPCWPISSFDIEAARQRVQESTLWPAGLRVSTTQFPEALPQVCFEAEPRLLRGFPSRRRPGQPSPAAPVEAPPRRIALWAVGFEQLKDEVVISQRRADDLTRRVDAARDSLDRVCARCLDYFHDLTTQLNYLKPRIGRDYYFLGGRRRAISTWLEGYADFRTQSESDGGRIEQVTSASP